MISNIEEYLDGITKNDLKSIILTESKSNKKLFKKLFTSAQKYKSSIKHANDVQSQNKNSCDIDSYKCLINDAISTIDDCIPSIDSFDYYEIMQSETGLDLDPYLNDLEEVVVQLEQLLTNKKYNELIELTKYFVNCIEDEINKLEDEYEYYDSEDQFEIIFDKLQKLHCKACIEYKSTPKEFAHELFKLEAQDKYGAFAKIIPQYIDVLGKEGLEIYKKLALEKWEKEKHRDTSNYKKKDNLIYIIEFIYEYEGDLESLIKFKSMDLSKADHYLDVASTFKRFNKTNKAIEWAKNGLEKFTDRYGENLRNFLIDTYHELGEHEKAVSLAWDRYSLYPSFSSYKEFKKNVDRLSNHAWLLTWRIKALDRIRETIKNKKENKYLHSDGSNLVEIFIWEKDTEQAWQEAVNGSCSEDLWIRLADLRSKDYPDDSISVYKRFIKEHVAEMREHAYTIPLRLIRKISNILTSLGRKNEFREYIGSLMVVHKRKKNLMKQLNQIMNKKLLTV